MSHIRQYTSPREWEKTEESVVKRKTEKQRIREKVNDSTETKEILNLLLLNTTCPVLANSVDPDQLASEEAN